MLKLHFMLTAENLLECKHASDISAPCVYTIGTRVLARAHTQREKERSFGCHVNERHWTASLFHPQVTSTLHSLSSFAERYANSAPHTKHKEGVMLYTKKKHTGVAKYNNQQPTHLYAVSVRHVASPPVLEEAIGHGRP